MAHISYSSAMERMVIVTNLVGITQSPVVRARQSWKSSSKATPRYAQRYLVRVALIWPVAATHLRIMMREFVS
jgi:hypothetical protein